MAAASFLASFAAIYYWFPKLYGRMMDERLGKWHFWLSVVGITLVFGGQMVAGYAGQQRRLYDPFQYTFLEHLRGLNKATSHAAFALGLSQLLFVVNFFRSMFAGKKAPANPWQVDTLEWETTSPPPHHNFDVVPTVVRGPHEYANPEARKLLKRDWLSQTEILPEAAGTAKEAEAIPAE
jgi:cytochrome c oxidase subunit I